MNTNTLLNSKRNFFMRGILSLLLICLSSGIALADIIGANDYQTCGLTAADSGNIFCWGDNNSTGSIPSSITASQISMGVSHICVITTDTNIICWGDNTFGQAPSFEAGPFIQVSAGDFHTCALTLDGDIKCWGDNADGQAPTLETGPFQQVSAGSAHTCALTSEDQLKCWGNNEYGQAPLEPVAGTFKQISANGYHTCGLTSNDEMTCWGDNVYSEVGPFSYISTGFNHTCAIKVSSGEIQCWGDDRNSKVSLPSQAGGNFVKVSVGFDHTCAVKESGNVSCWGDNTYNQTDVPVDVVLNVMAGSGTSDAGTSASDTTGTSTSDVGTSASDTTGTSTSDTETSASDTTGTSTSDAETSASDTTGTSTNDAGTSASDTETSASDTTGTSTSDAGTSASDTTGTSTSDTTTGTPTGSEPTTSCEPATYSNETRQVILPYVEVPLYTDVDGKSILLTGLFSATLEIPFGFSDIQVIQFDFIDTIDQNNSCHAQFIPETGLLVIPVLDVPTIIPSLTNSPISGPHVECNATLQQSILRPDVLSLTEFNCRLP